MKTKIKIIALVVFGCGAINSAFAQDFNQHFDTAKINHNPTPVQHFTNVAQPKKPKQLSKEMSFGIRLNTNGWSGFVDYGKILPIDSRHADRFHKVKLFQVELTEKESPREYKSSSGAPSGGGGSSSYIFGKINNLYVLKLGYGGRKMIAGKPDDKGAVSIHWVNVGGLGIGFLKPYYLNISGDPNAIKYGPDTKSSFLDPNEILGSASFSQGFSEVKIVPGIHYKSALHFDFSSNMKNVIAIETGVNAEYYFGDVPLMANVTSVPYFVDVYLSFQFGRKW